MKRILSLALLCLLPIVLANFSSEKGDSAKGGNTLNIYGKVTTRDPNETLSIENILISGQYENIDVYPKPTDKKTDPRENRAPLNLLDVRSIIPQVTAGKSPVAYIFDNHEYIEIVVLRKNKKKETYLIDRDKQLSCHVIGSDSKQKRIIMLKAVKKLDIAGFHCQDEKAAEVSQNEKEKVKQLVAELKADVQEVAAPAKAKIEKKIQELENIIDPVIE